MSSVMAREEPLIKQLARSRALVGGGSRPSRYAHNINFKCWEKKGVARNRVKGGHLNLPQVKPMIPKGRRLYSLSFLKVTPSSMTSQGFIVFSWAHSKGIIHILISQSVIAGTIESIPLSTLAGISQLPLLGGGWQHPNSQGIFLALLDLHWIYPRLH